MTQLGLEVRIRPVCPDDAPGVARLLNELIATAAPIAFDAPLTEAAERSYIAAFPERGVFLVAVAPDDSLIGFQSLEPFATSTHLFDHVGVIGTYVDPRYQRRGVAARLFTETLETAKAKGYEKIFTYIRADNPAALAAYAKQGFEVIGRARRHAKVEGRYVDELMVELFL